MIDPIGSTETPTSPRDAGRVNHNEGRVSMGGDTQKQWHHGESYHPQVSKLGQALLLVENATVTFLEGYSQKQLSEERPGLVWLAPRDQPNPKQLSQRREVETVKKRFSTVTVTRYAKYICKFYKRSRLLNHNMREVGKPSALNSLFPNTYC